MKPKCVLLFSGGLDSTLAGLLLNELGIEVYPFMVVIPFLSGKKFDRVKIIEKKLQKKIFRYNAGMDYVNLILKPKYGYGSGMNPCIDCKIYMLKKAKEYMESIKADFIATGEVLNQRPMSQRGWQLKIIEKEAGLEGMILRPLSAKVLKETIPEKKGLIEREKLLDIEGRQRKKQIELARKYGINDVSTSGGCLLADKNYVERFKKLIEQFPNFNIEDVELLRYGRHFYIEGTKVIVGRDKQENEIIKKYYNPQKHLLIAPNFSAPTILGYKSNNVDEEQLKKLMLEYLNRYSKNSHKLPSSF